MKSLIELAERIFEDAVDDSREVQKAVSELDSMTNRVQSELVHLARHCLTDADIRKSDAHYRLIQNRELRKAIEAVRVQKA